MRLNSVAENSHRQRSLRAPSNPSAITAAQTSSPVCQPQKSSAAPTRKGGVFISGPNPPSPSRPPAGETVPGALPTVPNPLLLLELHRRVRPPTRPPGCPASGVLLQTAG